MSERIKGVRQKVYNGVKYRSTLEADTAETLDKLGIPFEYEKLHFTLLDGFECPYQKKKVIGIKYTPDFSINGSIILECKGYETPEWRQKKKYIYKYLMEHMPDVAFYQTRDSRKSLLQALDSHWTHLGYAVKATSKERGKRTNSAMSLMFESVAEAMEALGLQDKSPGMIMKSLIGETQYVYGYNWKLVKLKM